MDGFCSSPNVRHLSNRFLCPASDGVIIQSRTSSARLGRDRRTRSFALVPYIKIPYVTLFPAMVVCSLVGGRLAGILAAGVGGIIAWYLWLPPRGTFSLEWPTAKLTILLYVLTSTILLLLTRRLNETLKDHRTVELNLRWPVTSGWYEKRQCAHHQFCRDFITSFYQAGPKQ